MDNDILEKYINKITGIVNIPIDKVIITNADDPSYCGAVNMYSRSGDNVTITDTLTGVAKTIAHEINGEMNSTIIIRDYMIDELVEFIMNGSEGRNECSGRSKEQAAIFFHEVGHALLNAVLYNKFHFQYTSKRNYKRCEMNQYYIDQGLSLFEEYYAQSFAESIVPIDPRYNADGINKHLSGIKNEKDVIGHSWWTAYQFSILAAQADQKGMKIDYKQYNLDDSLKLSIELFCLALKNRYLSFPDAEKNFDISNKVIAHFYKELIKAEEIIVYQTN